ncbi:glycogen debranching enzyme [Massarina eburnea CBS 473.64]|uniref:Glycogen debranching enzyme n=1 Tax=Massarina eburnea CBS 473.64 TaxID=1395130 RepID=A0A6A6RPA6_9PLEO|nr:glycogen debranching enzyme [Massarina eburnea CBS 473.64]
MALRLIAVLLGTAVLSTAADCPSSTLHVSEPPYENYFLSDCRTSSHVIVTSPGNDSEKQPRLLVVWPSGNTGIAAYFTPENGVDGSLGINLESSTTTGQVLESLDLDSGTVTDHPRVGVAGLVHFDSPAILTLPILADIRAIRDYSEGGGNLHPEIQNQVQEVAGPTEGSATIYRTWFDNKTTSWLDFAPSGSADAVRIIPGDKYTVRFGQGTYSFRATNNYPQLSQLSPQKVLSPASSSLIAQNADQTTALSFLSYTNKLVAGSWRFLTYFGRDSMISVLLMQSILSEDQDGAIEAAISAVLERVNKTDGTVCHEEWIADWASWTNLQTGIDSDAPGCDYHMIDTSYYLPILVQKYFLDTSIGKNRSSDFFNEKASFLQGNVGLSYQSLLETVAEGIMRTSAPFAGSQTVENLIHLKDGTSSGEWRDSSNGLGGGRIPYDVNTALVPAGLRAISALAKGGLFSDAHNDWKTLADEYAQVWEDKTLDFFKVNIPAAEARDLVNEYKSQSAFPGSAQTDKITGDVTFYGLALNGSVGTDQPIVKVMNTDDCFRLFLLDTTNQTQLSAFLQQNANNILAPFPVGLSSEASLLVSNPAYGGSQAYADNWSNSQYHGTVIWSWQLAMMAAGLQRQLDRCKNSTADTKPDFCDDSKLYNTVVAAYNHLWDLIDANRSQLSGEVWSWKYADGEMQAVPYNTYVDLESDVIQLWSLTFLAITRDQSYSQ